MRQQAIPFNPLYQAGDQTHTSAVSQTSAVGVVFFFSPSFLGSHLWHMEVLGLGVKLELQLPVYITVTATPEPRHICDQCGNTGSLTH